MKIGPDMKPYFVQYQASKAKKHLTLKQRSVFFQLCEFINISKLTNIINYFVCRVGIVEESAIRELKERLYANKSALMAAFLERDKENTGKNTVQL